MELHFIYNGTTLFKVDNSDIVPGINNWIELPEGVREAYDKEQWDFLMNNKHLKFTEDRDSKSKIIFKDLDKDAQDRFFSKHYCIGDVYVRSYSVNYQSNAITIILGKKIDSLEAAVMESPTNKWAEKRKERTEAHMRRERKWDHTLFGGLLGHI